MTRKLTLALLALSATYIATTSSAFSGETNKETFAPNGSQVTQHLGETDGQNSATVELGTTARGVRKLIYRRNLVSNGKVVGIVFVYSSPTGFNGHYIIKNTTNQRLLYRIRIHMRNRRSDDSTVYPGSTYQFPNARLTQSVELLAVKVR